MAGEIPQGLLRKKVLYALIRGRFLFKDVCPILANFSDVGECSPISTLWMKTAFGRLPTFPLKKKEKKDCPERRDKLFTSFSLQLLSLAHLDNA